jgi:hypothetical protein
MAGLIIMSTYVFGSAIIGANFAVDMGGLGLVK